MKRIRVISLAVIAALSLTVTSFAAEKSPQQSAAAYLSEAGIMLGNESGDMMLEQGLTRAQMAALLTRIVTDPEQFETDSAFYHPRTGELIVSAKETEVNPFFGAEERHPVGSRRFAMISGKYGGGVFCNLPDGVTCMCNYSYQHEDADFMVGEHVMLMVQRYDQEKLQMYGKIMSKW